MRAAPSVGKKGSPKPVMLACGAVSSSSLGGYLSSRRTAPWHDGTWGAPPGPTVPAGRQSSSRSPESCSSRCGGSQPPVLCRRVSCSGRQLNPRQSHDELRHLLAIRGTVPMPIRGGGARVSAWSACRTENGSAVSELRCRSASAASWSGPAEGPTEYKVAARRFAPHGELPSDYRSAFLQGELDRETPIQALTIIRPYAPVSLPRCCRREPMRALADRL